VEINEIKEKLEEALEAENWDIIIEIIGDLETQEHYVNPYDAYDEDEI